VGHAHALWVFRGAKASDVVEGIFSLGSVKSPTFVHHDDDAPPRLQRRPDQDPACTGWWGGEEGGAACQLTSFWRSQFRHRHSTAGGGSSWKRARDASAWDPMHNSPAALAVTRMCPQKALAALGGQKATKGRRGNMALLENQDMDLRHSPPATPKWARYCS
jgi:hypothetical protein